MLVLTTIKRSPPMAEPEARIIAKKTDLFGYRPEILGIAGQCFLMIRGDGADDIAVNQQLAALRRAS